MLDRVQSADFQETWDRALDRLSTEQLYKLKFELARWVHRPQNLQPSSIKRIFGLIDVDQTPEEIANIRLALVGRRETPIIYGLSIETAISTIEALLPEPPTTSVEIPPELSTALRPQYERVFTLLQGLHKGVLNDLRVLFVNKDKREDKDFQPNSVVKIFSDQAVNSMDLETAKELRAAIVGKAGTPGISLKVAIDIIDILLPQAPTPAATVHSAVNAVVVIQNPVDPEHEPTLRSILQTLSDKSIVALEAFLRVKQEENNYGYSDISTNQLIKFIPELNDMATASQLRRCIVGVQRKGGLGYETTLDVIDERGISLEPEVPEGPSPEELSFRAGLSQPKINGTLTLGTMPKGTVAKVNRALAQGPAAHNPYNLVMESLGRDPLYSSD